MRYFQSPLEYIEAQKPVHQDILYLLRDFILSEEPLLKEEIKYGLCIFYSFDNAVICYLSVKAKRLVDFGFVDGHLLKDADLYLCTAGRKRVRSFEIRKTEDIRLKHISHFLKAAICLRKKIKAEGLQVTRIKGITTRIR